MLKGNKKFSISTFFLGILTGVFVTLLTVFIFLSSPGGKMEKDAVQPESSTAVAAEEETAETETDGEDMPEEKETADEGQALPSDTWDAEKVYNGGETVSYHGKMYRCRWWTQGEQPGEQDGPWEDLMTSDPDAEGTAQPENISNVPVDASVPGNPDAAGFKIVGYYPSWSPDSLGKVDFNVLTHVNYAFAIPNPDGTLKPLENEKTA